MLYRPGHSRPLVERPGQASRSGGNPLIVEDADAAFRGPRLFWRANEWDGWHGTSPMKNLYVGTAGVLWALDRLRRRGYTETKLDLASLAHRNVELFRERPDYMKGMKLPALRRSALLTGETGVLLVAWRLSPSSELADQLFERVRANVDSEADEVMWGTPGTLLAAQAMLSGPQKSGGRRVERGADALLSHRDEGPGPAPLRRVAQPHAAARGRRERQACSRCSTRIEPTHSSEAPCTPATRSGRRVGELAAAASRAARAGRPDPRPVVRRRTGDRRRGRVPRRGASPAGASFLAHRIPLSRGTGHLSRHRWQRLCVPQSFADRRGGGSGARDLRSRAPRVNGYEASAAAGATRLDRRRRFCALFGRLHHRYERLSRIRRLLALFAHVRQAQRGGRAET
jgi:hypothetical protein